MKPREWNMAESILHFQDNVPAVGPMIKVVEHSALEAAEALIERLDKLVTEAQNAVEYVRDKRGGERDDVQRWAEKWLADIAAYREGKK